MNINSLRIFISVFLVVYALGDNLKATEDAFVRGGQHRLERHGGDPELTLKTHMKPSVTRISLIRFSNVTEAYMGKSTYLALFVTASFLDEGLPSSDELSVCSLSPDNQQKWEEKTVTQAYVSSWSQDRFQRCIFVRLKKRSLAKGTPLCVHLPPKMLTTLPLSSNSNTYTLNLELQLVPKINQNQPMASSERWVSFASIQHPELPGPHLHQDAARCRGLQHNLSVRNCSEVHSKCFYMSNDAILRHAGSGSTDVSSVNELFK